MSGSLIWHARDDALVDERVQASRQHVARDAEMAADVVETAYPVEDLAEHEKRPPVAEDGERPTGRACLAVVVQPSHDVHHTHLGCAAKLSSSSLSCSDRRREIIE